MQNKKTLSDDVCLSDVCESKLQPPHPILNLVQGHNLHIPFFNIVLHTKPDDEDDQDYRDDPDDEDDQDDQDDQDYQDDQDKDKNQEEDKNQERDKNQEGGKNQE